MSEFFSSLKDAALRLLRGDVQCKYQFILGAILGFLLHAIVF